MAELIFLIYKEFIPKKKKKKRYNPEEQHAEDINRSFTGKKWLLIIQKDIQSHLYWSNSSKSKNEWWLFTHPSEKIEKLNWYSEHVRGE